MKKSKVFAVAASAILFSTCACFSVSASTSKSGKCSKTETNYTDILTSYDYDKTAALSVGYYYKSSKKKSDMLCTYAYGDGGTKVAKIYYNGSESECTKEDDSATVQLSITKAAGSTVKYLGWQVVGSSTTANLTYTLTLT